MITTLVINHGTLEGRVSGKYLQDLYDEGLHILDESGNERRLFDFDYHVDEPQDTSIRYAKQKKVRIVDVYTDQEETLSMLMNMNVA